MSITRVQSHLATVTVNLDVNGTPFSLNVTLPSPSAPGNFLLLVVGYDSDNISYPGISSIVDTQLNGFTSVFNTGHGTNTGPGLACFYASGSAGGSETVTINFGTSWLGFGSHVTNVFAWAFIAEYSGMPGGTVSDKVNQQNYGGFGASLTLTHIGTPVTCSVACAANVNQWGLINLNSSLNNKLIAFGISAGTSGVLPGDDVLTLSTGGTTSIIGSQIGSSAGGEYLVVYDAGAPSPPLGTTKYFPDLPGKGWGWTRRNRWTTLIHTGASGFEYREMLQSLPIWEWELVFHYIRALTPYFNFETLAGFNNARLGGFSSFFFRDEYDHQVLGQFIATGDGITTEYQLVRTMNGFDEPIAGVDKRGSATYGPYTRPATITPQAYVAGSPVSATFSTETGVMTLATASGTSGQLITADFSYVWRVRFEDDNIDFKNVFGVIHSIAGLKLVQSRI